MPGAASASVQDLTPTGGYQLKLVGGCTEKSRGVLTPLRGCRKIPDIVTDQIFINGTVIKQMQSAKFLGMYLDQHLSWTTHIESVIGKISKTCGILKLKLLKLLKFRLTKTILLTIYQSLILPYLQYCATVWALFIHKT